VHVTGWSLLSGKSSGQENGEPLGFCPHCGAKVLMAEPALMATETGFMSRVKQVEPVILIMREGGLDVWSLTKNEAILILETAEIQKTEFVGSRVVAAPLPQLGQQLAQQHLRRGDARAMEFLDSLLRAPGRNLLIDLYHTSVREKQWRGITLVLRDARRFFFAIERTKGLFWKSPAWKLSKAISAMVKATQPGR